MLRFKTRVFASALLAAAAFLAVPASAAIPVPIVECLYPPDTRDNVCRTDWIFVPVYW